MQITHRIPWDTPYGYTEVTYDSGEAVDFERIAIDAQTMEDSYRAVGGGQRHDDGDPGPQEPPPTPSGTPPHTQTSSNGGARGGGNGGSSEYGVTFMCPDHQAELRPSVRNKTMDFDDELGMEIPASWFHTTPDGKTCSVYRSRAVRVGR